MRRPKKGALSPRAKWALFGIWLVSTLVVFALAHVFEVRSIASDPEAEQRFKGYGAFIAGGYNVFRVGAITIFGALVIYWLTSFVFRLIHRIRHRPPPE